VVNLEAGSLVRRQFQALPQDRWVIIQVKGEGAAREREFRYYDAEFNYRGSQAQTSNYRATSRPWYQQASREQVHKTSPYLFQHLQAPGQTYSVYIKDADAVLAVDIALFSLADQLQESGHDEATQTYLYQAGGEVIASNQGGVSSEQLPEVPELQLSPAQQALVAEHPVLNVSNEMDWAPFDFVVAGEPYGYSIDLLNTLAAMIGLEIDYVNGLSWPELYTLYRNNQLDILHPLLPTRENSEQGRLTQPLLDIEYGVLTPKGEEAITRIEQLFGKTLAIPRSWSSIQPLKNHFPEINILEVEDVKEVFAAVREGRADAGLDMVSFLQYSLQQYFIDDLVVHQPLDFGEVKMPPSLHYLVHPSLEGIASLLDEALSQLPSQYRQKLAERWLLTDDETDALQASRVPYVELLELASDPDSYDRLQKLRLGDTAYYLYLQPLGESIAAAEYFAAMTPVADVLASVRERVLWALLITGASLLLLLPLSSWLATFIVNPIRHLAQENRKVQARQFARLQPLRSRIIEIDELAASLMDMADSIEQHSDKQEALMEAFIQVIAQAIDDKSPVTGRHCARVPELALILARKAEECQQAPFEAPMFEHEDQWREFRIAAWLHDCGKISVPDYVIDKSTKLDVFYNRIHEIRMRFEVLWRDAEIEYLEACQLKPEQQGELYQQLQNKQTELQQDFAFIARCNQGRERMPDEDVQRLQALAEKQWLRHFDNRLGLAQEELRRFERQDKQPLPVIEKLLSDQPWQLVERDQPTDYPEHLGIKMQAPDYLYNQGELHNLTVIAGTLTEEDRFKIQEHMISTIKMLDGLPLPSELSRVPRYATTHHETLNGLGYPRQLDAKDLSMPERILVVADVFEALTAADRPYKKPNRVSTAVAILYKMVEKGRIDRDVFELFLTSGAYREYAERFLKPEQLDEINLDSYVARQ
jgi:HD-GYP domain-containing protein (c-di-GMP phosphodiesterase class II)/ABC-type amino acid transport substrate-binding protein